MKRFLVFLLALMFSVVGFAQPGPGASVGAVQNLLVPIGKRPALRNIATNLFRHQTGKVVASDTGYTEVKRCTLKEAVNGWIYCLYTYTHVSSSSGELPTITAGYGITLTGSIEIYNNSAFSEAITPLAFGPANASSYVLMPKAQVWARAYVGYIPAGTDIRVRTRRVTTTGANIPVGHISGASGDGYFDGDAVMTITPTLSSNATYGPAAICAYVEGGNALGVGIVGDSITYGVGDTTAGGGWLVRRLETLGIGYVQVSKSGEQLNEWITTYSRRVARLRAATTMPVIVCGYGVNDIWVGGRTVAQIKADYLLAWAELAMGGTRRVYQTTLTPRTTSTDSWATVANQTIYNAGTDNVTRTAINNWLRAPASAGSGNSALYDAAGSLTGVIDTAATVEVNSSGVLTLNGGYWTVADGAPTTDGYHPATAVTARIGTAITTALSNYWKAGAGLTVNPSFSMNTRENLQITATRDAVAVVNGPAFAI